MVRSACPFIRGWQGRVILCSMPCSRQTRSKMWAPQPSAGRPGPVLGRSAKAMPLSVSTVWIASERRPPPHAGTPPHSSCWPRPENAAWVNLLTRSMARNTVFGCSLCWAARTRAAFCEACSSARTRGTARALPCRTPAIARPPQNGTTHHDTPAPHTWLDRCGKRERLSFRGERSESLNNGASRLESQAHQKRVRGEIGAGRGAFQALVREAGAQHHGARELVLYPGGGRKSLFAQGHATVVRFAERQRPDQAQVPA